MNILGTSNTRIRYEFLIDRENLNVMSCTVNIRTLNKNVLIGVGTVDMLHSMASFIALSLLASAKRKLRSIYTRAAK